MKQTIKQVEELEEQYEDTDEEYKIIIIQKAKLLKAEIEKGCGENLTKNVGYEERFRWK